MPQKFQTLAQLLEYSVRDYPASDAFGEKGADGFFRWRSYRELGELVAAARAGLAARGVGAGDRVAVIANNRVEWAVLAFATYGLGAVFVPLYEAQAAEEWAFILGDSGSRVVVAATEEIFEKLKGLRGACPELAHVLCLELPADHPDSYAALLGAGRAAPRAALAVAPSDLAGLIYTSGTTGSPKGVELSHANISTNVLASAERFDFGPGDRSLAFLPWAHAFGQTAELYTLLHYGAALAINDAVPSLIDNLAVVRPTVLVAVPRIFNRIYDGVNKQMAERPSPVRALFRAGIAAATKRGRVQPLLLTERLALEAADRLIFAKVRKKFGGRLRFVVSGSAALSTEVAEFIAALGIDVYEGYGLTETAPVVAANYPGHRKVGSVGPPLPGVEVLVDREATGDALHGELVVRGPNVMRGYHNRPEETALVLRPDGALRTGDMGYIDADGYVFITGRIKEQYKLETGKYVVPSPLEEELKLSPFVANCMLYGDNRPYNVALVVPDPAALASWAERERRPLGDPSRDPAVKALLKAELDRRGAAFKSYERPRDIAVITEDFTQENGLLTPSLKVKRRAVLARYAPLIEDLYRGAPGASPP